MQIAKSRGSRKTTGIIIIESVCTYLTFQQAAIRLNISFTWDYPGLVGRTVPISFHDSISKWARFSSKDGAVPPLATVR